MLTWTDFLDAVFVYNWEGYRNAFKYLHIYHIYIYMFVNVQKGLYKDLHQTFTSGSCENGDEFGEGVKEGFIFPW